MQQPAYSGRNSRTALVLCADPKRRAELAALAKACQCNVLEDTSGMYSDRVDVLLADVRTESEDVCHSLSEMRRYLESHRCIALIWTDMEMLDSAYAAFHNEQTHFLVDADDIEAVPFLAGFFRRSQMN